MIKTNREIENQYTEEREWLFCYATGSYFYIHNALHVARNEEFMSSMGNYTYDDNDACHQAEQDGVPFIYGMKHVPDGVYVDTEENRQIIRRMLEEYPFYKNVVNG